MLAVQSQTACLNCSPGSYNPFPGFTCTNCPVNTYSASSGATSCTNCATGTSSHRGSDESGDCLSPGPECASEAAIVIACFDAVGESGASACCDEVATLESCFGGVCVRARCVCVCVTGAPYDRCIV